MHHMVASTSLPRQQMSRPRLLFPLPLLLLLLLMMMIVLVAPVEAQETQSTCGAATKLHSKTTYVTCNFMQDIYTFGFNVQFYPGDGKPAETALACNRLKGDGLNCHMGRGVYFDERQEVRHRLSFRRNESMNIPGSQYQCQVVSALGNAERCTVALIDIPESDSTQPPQLNADDQEINDRSFPIVVTLLVLVILMILAAAGILVYKNRERIMKHLSKQKDTSGENVELGAVASDSGPADTASDGGTGAREETDPMLRAAEKAETRQPVRQPAVAASAAPEDPVQGPSGEEYFDAQGEPQETDEMKKVLREVENESKSRMAEAENKIKDLEKEAFQQSEEVKKEIEAFTSYVRKAAARDVKLEAARKALEVVRKADARAKEERVKSEATKIIKQAQGIAKKIHEKAKVISKEK